MAGLPKLNAAGKLDWSSLLGQPGTTEQKKAPETPATSSVLPSSSPLPQGNVTANASQAQQAQPSAQGAGWGALFGVVGSLFESNETPSAAAAQAQSPAPRGLSMPSLSAVAKDLYQRGEDFTPSRQAWAHYEAVHGLAAVPAVVDGVLESISDRIAWMFGKLAALALGDGSAEGGRNADFGSTDHRAEVVDWFSQATSAEGPAGNRVEPSEVSSLGERLSTSGVPHPRQLRRELDGDSEHPGLLPDKPYGDDYYKLPANKAPAKLTARQSEAQTIFYSWMVDEAARQARGHAPLLPSLSAAALQNAKVGHEDSSTIQDPVFRCGTNPGLYSVALADGTTVEIQHMPEGTGAAKKSPFECTADSDDRKGKILLAAHGADGKYRRLDEASVNALLDKVNLSRAGCRVLQLHEEPMRDSLSDWLSHYSKADGAPYVAPEQFAAEVYPRLLQQLASNTVFELDEAKPANGFYGGDVPSHKSLYELGALLGKSPAQINSELRKLNPSIRTLY